MTKRKNRSIYTIADDIHKLARTNIFEIGDLLIEAKAMVEHGEWLEWLDEQFEWSDTTATRYMRVAELSAKFPNLKNLKLTKTTLYELADHNEEEELPAIIAELAKHSTLAQLRPRDGQRYIKIGIGRHRFGDRPAATLVYLVELNDDVLNEDWHPKAVAALQQQNPDTDEGAQAIVDRIEQEHFAAEREAEKAERDAQRSQAEEDERELTEILDGPGPDLPLPTTPPEPQRISGGTAWAEQEPFEEAVAELLRLSSKPINRFVCGKFSPADIREVGEFLLAVAAANKQEAA